MPASPAFLIGGFLAALHQVQGRESAVRPSGTALAEGRHV
jgi:hypothetical protein